jgi:hypothetical protein
VAFHIPEQIVANGAELTKQASEALKRREENRPKNRAPIRPDPEHKITGDWDGQVRRLVLRGRRGGNRRRVLEHTRKIGRERIDLVGAPVEERHARDGIVGG